MRFLSAKLYLLTLMLLFSCKEVNRELENETLLNNTKTNSEELIEEPIEDYLEKPEQDSKSNTKKIVRWSDGNSYEYDFIDKIDITNNMANGDVIDVLPIKIYRNNYPSESNCKYKNCNWCNSIIYPVSSSYEEYPNLNDLFEYRTVGSILGLIYQTGGDNAAYINEFEAIRTEWILVCNYDEVNGYCSNKCYNEAVNQ